MGAKPNMGVRNKSRCQFRKRGKIGLNQSLIYPCTHPFPTLSPDIFLFTRLQLSSQKHYYVEKTMVRHLHSPCPSKFTLCRPEGNFPILTLNICAISEVARQRTERPPRFAFTLCTRSVQLTRNCSRWDTNRGTWKPFAY